MKVSDSRQAGAHPSDEAIAAGVAAGHIRLWELLTMAVIFGIGDAFFDPASVAIVPELLPAELLVQGNALTATSQPVRDHPSADASQKKTGCAGQV